MSLRIKQYKLFTRNWLEKELKHLDNCFECKCKYCECKCKYCGKLNHIKVE